MLLVADSGAFFTIYSTITGIGLRAYQLDRDNQHKPAVPEREVRTPVTSAVSSPTSHHMLHMKSYPWASMAILTKNV